MNKACLKFYCPDRAGIVARISEFLFANKLNIINLEQHSENGIFFTRIKWEDIENWKNEAEFQKDFASICDEFQGQVFVHFFARVQTCGLFVSRELHALAEILTKVELGDYENIQIPFIISNSRNAEKLANYYNIPFYYTPTKKDSFAHEEKQLEIIAKYSPDFIGLARYMKILSADFINQVGCPIINIHHSFLPSFVGARPYEMAYERGVKLIGATSHFVIPELDQGPIIEQDVARIRSGYSILKMKKQGADIEKKVFARALAKVFEHKVLVYENRTVVFE